MSPNFTPVASALGGALIGLSASIVLLYAGKVAGISGIVGGLLGGKPADATWRFAFLGGLLAAGVGGVLLAPQALANTSDRPLPALIVAGLLVGFGTRLGNGCTSGHGICGLSRLSPRSLASVVTFMGFGMVAAVLAGRLLGGAA